MINSATTAKLRALAATPAELFEMLCWIPTERQYPEANRFVIASYGGGHCYMMVFDGDRWISTENNLLKPRTPRFWCYMPHGPIDARRETAQ